MRTYPAPWSRLLVVTSVTASVVCVGVTLLLASRIQSGEFPASDAWVAVLPVLVPAIAALYMIRGYTVTGDEILVERLLWQTRLPRRSLESAAVDPAALAGSIRLFGNGGLFSFTGLFYSRHIGRYRAFVTDPKRTVILRFRDRVVVVSPADPETFVRELSPAR